MLFLNSRGYQSYGENPPFQIITHHNHLYLSDFFIYLGKVPVPKQLRPLANRDPYDASNLFGAPSFGAILVSRNLTSGTQIFTQIIENERTTRIWKRRAAA